MKWSVFLLAFEAERLALDAILESLATANCNQDTVPIRFALILL